MKKIITFLQEIFMLKKDDSIKIGLTQFKTPTIEPVKKNVSIKQKEVKLSDLMRRAG